MERILLIEDDRGSQLLFHNRLQELGYEVVVAPTGARGLMEARAARFDLFLVDIGLGSGIDGYEVCRRLKSVPQIHRVPVVLISGEVKSRDELHRGYEAGCEAFLLKGDLTLVEDVVRVMLRIGSLQAELVTQNRLLEERNRRLSQEQQRASELERALRETDHARDRPGPGSEGPPDGILVVDEEGVVRAADRGAHDLFDMELEGRHLASLAPRTGLEAFVLGARSAPSTGYRFDVEAAGRIVRPLVATVLPALPSRAGWLASQAEGICRVVLLRDLEKTRPNPAGGPVGVSLLPSRELGPLLEAARIAFGPAAFQGLSPEREQVRAALRDLAAVEAPVLLSGPDGTGKVLAARAIHFSGERSGPFVPVECSSLSPRDLERELWGDEKAEGESQGLASLARDGTLFLRSIDVLTPHLQERLADFIEQDDSRSGPRRSGRGIRVVTSSRSDLHARAADGHFSPRLLEQLSGFELHLPVLEASSPDIPVLVEHFLHRHGAGRGVVLSSEAQWVLCEYAWPGNVGELESCVEAVCRNVRGEVGVTDLPTPLQDFYAHLSDADRIPASLRRGPTRGDPLTETYEPTSSLDEAPSLEAYERKAILHALHATGGDKVAAAKLLGIGKSTFYRKLRQHGIGSGTGSGED